MFCLLVRVLFVVGRGRCTHEQNLQRHWLWLVPVVSHSGVGGGRVYHLRGLGRVV